MSGTRTAVGLGETWKVGALARATGVTVRALHHYDRIGLLCPSARNAAGHRLYSPDDVARLYRITLLRRLGFPLDQIASVLDDPQWELASATRRHLAHAREVAVAATSLCSRLADMAAALDGADQVDAAQLFATLEEMTMTDTAIRSTAGMLVYDDLTAAHDYIVRVFGLASAGIEHDEDGRAIHAEVRAGEQVIMLHPVVKGVGSPRSAGLVTSMTIVTVDDVDEHYARTVAAGARIAEEPVDQAYGVREYGVRDPEGQLWYFHSPLA